MHIKFFIMLVAIYTLPITDVWSQHEGIVGDQSPAFDYERALAPNGNEKSIIYEEFKGKVIVMLFFQYTCDLCLEKSFPALKNMYNKYADNKDVVFLAVQTSAEKYYINNFEKLSELREQFDLPIYYAYDPGDLKMEYLPPSLVQFKAPSMPWFVIIDQRGKVAFNDLHLSPSIGVMAIKSLL